MRNSEQKKRIDLNALRTGDSSIFRVARVGRRKVTKTYEIGNSLRKNLRDAMFYLL